MAALFYFAIFILLITGFAYLFRLDKAVKVRLERKRHLREKKNRFKKRSVLRIKITRWMANLRGIIAYSQMPRGAYIIVTLLCGILGYVAGKVIYSSNLISAAVGIFGLCAPVLYFSYKQTRAKSLRLDRLAASMMKLSNSYLVTDDFIASVRNDLDTLDYPEPFKMFLAYVTLMDSDVSIGFRRMEQQVNNLYFSQWVDALILAQEDRSLKYVAVSVVESFHDVLQVQKESDAAMYAVWSDYFVTLALIFSVPLIFKILLADVYLALTTSTVGQSLFILLIITVLYSVIQALRINRPLMV